MKDGIFAPDKNNAPIVKIIFNDFIGGMKIREIASKLNSMGIKTTKGKAFENRTVEYILSNPAYIGLMRRRKDSNNKSDRLLSESECIYSKGEHDPLIDEETYSKAQDRLKTYSQD